MCLHNGSCRLLKVVPQPETAAVAMGDPRHVNSIILRPRQRQIVMSHLNVPRVFFGDEVERKEGDKVGGEHRSGKP